MEKVQEYQIHETTLDLKEDIVFLKSNMSPLSGAIIDFFEDGELMCHVNYINGKLNGKIREYYQNGFLKYEFNYKHGIRHGNFYGYNSQGETYFIETYSEGKLDGYCLYIFFESRKFTDKFNLFDSNFNLDSIKGYEFQILEQYFSDGVKEREKLHRRIDHEKYDDFDDFEILHKDKQEIIELNDFDLNESKDIIFVDDSIFVQQVYIENYKEELKDGTQMYWKIKDEYWDYKPIFYLNLKENYVLGEKEGEQFKWNANGDLIAHENYLNGKKHEKQSYFNKYGKSAVENYHNGLKNGTQEYWDSYGTKTLEENYLNGQLHGICTEKVSVVQFNLDCETYFAGSYTSSVSEYCMGELIDYQSFNDGY